MAVIQTACVPNTGGIAIYISYQTNPNGPFEVHVDGHGYHVAADRGVNESARALANAFWSEIVKRRNEGWSGPELVRAAGALNLEGVGPAVPVPPQPEITEGMWQLGDGIYKVQKSQAGRLYAMQASEDGGFTYVPGLMRTLREGGATPLTQERAAEFGKLYGSCCVCGRTLTNEISVASGIGPICASRQGW